MKTLLVIVDGMRPDALVKTEAARDYLEKSEYTLTARTVMPSVTLPCHMSLFHSAPPSRHGTTTNTYMPQVRPVNGICETLFAAKKNCAFFYNWEEIRDLSRPNSLSFAYFCKGRRIGYEKANNVITDAAIDYLTSEDMDFTFLYLGYTDMAGHDCGWMSGEYMAAMENSWNNISRLTDALSDDYTIIITADHGGHDRTHGSDLPEDMTIPVIIRYKGEKRETDLSDASILDIAPTVTALLGVAPEEEWEGRSLVK